MWGEIEAPVKTQPTSYESEDEGHVKLPDEAVTPSRRWDFNDPADPRQPRPDTQMTYNVNICPLSSVVGSYLKQSIFLLYRLCFCLSCRT